MEPNPLLLNHIFRKQTLRDLIQTQTNPFYVAAAHQYLQHAESHDHRTIIDDLYHILHTSHRNEYFYKNTLLHALISAPNRLPTTTTLSEVRIYPSQADFIAINESGDGVVYEIKTELDTLTRLRTQVSNYYQAFTRVCVVTFEANYDAVMHTLVSDSRVGIAVLTPTSTIVRGREPMEDRTHLTHAALFSPFRKDNFFDNPRDQPAHRTPHLCLRSHHRQRGSHRLRKTSRCQALAHHQWMHPGSV